jgi:uncharacterized membrane protein
MNESDSVNSKSLEKNVVGEEREQENLSKLQIIGYSTLIVISVSIFIISMIGADPLTLLIAFGISAVFIYFSDDFSENEENKKKT